MSALNNIEALLNQVRSVVETSPAEPEKITKLRHIVKNHQHDTIDGVMVDAFSANAVLRVYDALNLQNQDKYASLPVHKMAELAFKMSKEEAADNTPNAPEVGRIRRITGFAEGDNEDFINDLNDVLKAQIGQEFTTSIEHPSRDPQQAGEARVELKRLTTPAAFDRHGGMKPEELYVVAEYDLKYSPDGETYLDGLEADAREHFQPLLDAVIKKHYPDHTFKFSGVLSTLEIELEPRG